MEFRILETVRMYFGFARSENRMIYQGKKVSVDLGQNPVLAAQIQHRDLRHAKQWRVGGKV